MKMNTRIHLLRPFNGPTDNLGGSAISYADPLTNSAYSDTPNPPVVRYAARTDRRGDVGVAGDVQFARYVREYEIRETGAGNVSTGWLVVDLDEERTYRVTSVTHTGRRRDKVTLGCETSV